MLRKGLPEDIAKKISKLLRDEFPKVKSQIQGDAVRVTGKSQDDLQRVIARLRRGGGVSGRPPVRELSLRWTMATSRWGRILLVLVASLIILSMVWTSVTLH